MGNNASVAANISSPVASRYAAAVVADGRAVAAGVDHGVFLKSGGTVWSFGTNTTGQLGDNTTVNRVTAVQVKKSAGASDWLTGALAVAAGDGFSAALTSTGTVYAWGNRVTGRLGDGTTTGSSLFAVPVYQGTSGTTPLSGIGEISVAGANGFGVAPSTGNVWAWGNNASGQLGQGNVTALSRALRVKLNSSTYLTDALDVSCSADHAAIVRWKTGDPLLQGSVFCSGQQQYGRLGNNQTSAATISYPVQVLKTGGTPLDGIVSVAAGAGHTLALDMDGNVWAWGYNLYGELGDNTTTNRALAVQVAAPSGTGFLTDIVRISAGGSALFGYSMAVTTDGKVYAWGYNANGQLGNATTATTATKLPVLVTGGFDLSPNPPDVTLTSAIVQGTAPGRVNFSASATDLDNNVTLIEIFNQGVNVGSTSGGQLLVNSLAAGSYQAYARVTDATGLTGYSAPITIALLGDHTYTPNSRNHYASITTGNSRTAIGRADPAWSVLVAGTAATRIGDLYYRALTATNTSVPVWQSVVTMRSTGAPSTTNSFWYAKTPTVPTHDVDGNLTNDGRWIYSWDAEQCDRIGSILDGGIAAARRVVLAMTRQNNQNRLTQMETTTQATTAGQPYTKLKFVYDSQSRRIARHVWQGGTQATPTFKPASSRRWLYDGWNVVAEFSVPNETSTVLTRINTFTWGLDLSGTLQGAGGVGGLLVQTSVPGGVIERASYDGNGNIVAWTKSTNTAPTSRREYDAFGNSVVSEGTTPCNFGFSTKMQDVETGLLYYGYRFYDPAMGRWLNRDPIGEKGGINLQVFVGNNGVNQSDILGMASTEYLNLPVFYRIEGGHKGINQGPEGSGTVNVTVDKEDCETGGDVRIRDVSGSHDKIFPEYLDASGIIGILFPEIPGWLKLGLVSTTDTPKFDLTKTEYKDCGGGKRKKVLTGTASIEIEATYGNILFFEVYSDVGTMTGDETVIEGPCCCPSK